MTTDATGNVLKVPNFAQQAETTNREILACGPDHLTQKGVTLANVTAVTALSPPEVDTTATAVSGGSLTAGTYYYVITSMDAAGNESVVSDEISGTTAASNLTMDVDWTAATNAVKYVVYRGTVSGTYAKRAEVTAPTVTYQDSAVGSPSGAPPENDETAILAVIPAGCALKIKAGTGYDEVEPATQADIASVVGFLREQVDCSVATEPHEGNIILSGDLKANQLCYADGNALTVTEATALATQLGGRYESIHGILMF